MPKHRKRDAARGLRLNAAFLFFLALLGQVYHSFFCRCNACQSWPLTGCRCQTAVMGNCFGMLASDRERLRPMHVMPNNYIRIMDASALLGLLNNPENLLFASQCGEIQRNLDAEHLEDLIQFQMDFKDSSGFFFFPNPIFIASYKDKLAVLDGQHRLAAMKYFLEKTPENGPIRVLVSIIDLFSGTAEEYDRLFTVLNKNKPVKLYKNVRDYKEVLKLLEQFFNQKYRRYLKTTETPQRPNINMDKLLAFMDSAGVVSTLGLSYEELIKEIEDLNNVYRLHWKELIQEKGYIPNIEKHIETCKRKDPENSLFLGLYRNYEWLKRIELKVRSGKSYLQLSHVPDTFRPMISRQLRRAVWEKRNADKQLSGKCYCCGERVDYDCFVCGHVISLSNGGNTTLSNLEPICHMCNSEMSTTNLEEFRTELERVMNT
eukprot:TRINITY_DN29214_c0_g1_i1.p1 TRINITY_DN29214_c0_g1~~TRINITY_DN29214_c0_g1_i1.p1  ORF type:complete len:432 (-),score=59.27 TRINITY_DN29214_c0_g1_i1:125-1420(-)